MLLIAIALLIVIKLLTLFTLFIKNPLINDTG